MSETTKIEWATSTGNPWIGCTKVSPGCKNCYAAGLDEQRFSRTMGGGTKDKPVSHWGKGAPRFRTKGFWKDALKWNRGPFSCDTCGETFKQLTGRQKLCEPIPGDPCLKCNSGHYARPRIFPSLCDIFDEEVPIQWLADYLRLVQDTPSLDHLILTKRINVALKRLYLVSSVAEFPFRQCRDWLDGSPPENVWLGTSVEDQERADERIPELLKVPAKIRFLSVEPLLGPVDLDNCEGGGAWKIPGTRKGGICDAGIDWVIVGGESGPGARKCNIEWIRSVVQQCKAAGVPCFVKQLGSYSVFDYEPAWKDRPAVEQYAGKLKHPKGGDPSEWPNDLRVRQFPVNK